jgi:hypothetical protein
MPCARFTPQHCCQYRSARPPPGDRVTGRQWFLSIQTTVPRKGSSLLHLEANRGSLHLRVSRPPKPTTEADNLLARTPLLRAMRFTPFEEFPSSIAVPRLRGRCLLAVRFAPQPLEHRSTQIDHNTRQQVIRTLASPTTTHRVAPKYSPLRQVRHIALPSAEADGGEIYFPTLPKPRCSQNFATPYRVSFDREVVIHTALLTKVRRLVDLPEPSVQCRPLGTHLAESDRTTNIHMQVANRSSSFVRIGIFDDSGDRNHLFVFDPVVPLTAEVLTRPESARLPRCQSRQLQGFTPPTSP